MEHYRRTKAVINLGAITRNTQILLQRYPDYNHYTAVVKADCYGYRGNQVVQAMLTGGADTLACSLLEEGIALRAAFPNTPILLFTPIEKDYLYVCVQHKLTATVCNQCQAEDAAEIADLNVMIRANGGSDIFGGPTDRDSFHALYHTLNNGKCHLSGIYLHSYNAENDRDTESEYCTFENMVNGLDLSELEYVSISNSLTLPRYQKKSYANTCRLGNIIYGIEAEDAGLEETFRLDSVVHTTFHLPKGRSVAYSHAYTAQTDNEFIAAVPIGFGDGFSKTNIGRKVYINDREYPIVAVTMDITHIRVDETVRSGDTVVLIRDNHHLEEISAHIHGATEEPICALNKRVYREYIK